MGHVSTSYTTTVAPHMDVSTRFDFNIHSYESDLAVGFEYAPIHAEQLVKVRLSLLQVKY